MLLPTSCSWAFARATAVALLAFRALSAGDAQAAVIQLGPIPYLSAADSPLAADPTLATTIEDFEDGVFNLPGVVNVPIPPAPTNTTGDGIGIVVAPGPETDSVDGDDGAIDGFGTAGHSFRSNRFFNFTVEQSSISFAFLPDAHGHYPTAFGFVWTDGQQGVTLFGGGREIDDADFTYGSPELLGDMTFSGETAEDRFFGVRSSAGLKSFGINVTKFSGQVMTGLDYFEMDHLQVSYPVVPEPASALHAVILAAALASRPISLSLRRECRRVSRGGIK